MAKGCPDGKRGAQMAKGCPDGKGSAQMANRCPASTISLGQYMLHSKVELVTKVMDLPIQGQVWIRFVHIACNLCRCAH